jgi:hypothetical protein
LKTYKLFIYGDMTQYYKIVLYKCAVFWIALFIIFSY